QCEISNFDIIRNEDEPIRRFSDPPVTPQCVVCKKYPKTACGYALHMKRHHKSLNETGIYLICSCDTRFNNHNDQKKHDNECTGRDFTLHKLDED
ncbi:hypothetical protein PMAYCL1PPCAC_20797, partial [Pristionchus mayeri]